MIQLNQLKNCKLLILYIFIGFVVHLICPFFSVGFYSDDEHFQIIEPTAYLLGLNEVIIDDPSGYYWEWESKTRMRPWVQPYIYYYLINLFKLIGISNSFTWILILRILSSILGFLSIVYLFFVCKNDFFKNNNHFNYFIFFGFWFYPFLHSRTSSENISIILFLAAFCFLYKKIKYNNFSSSYFLLFTTSILLGMSLVFRFNLIFTIIPFFLWLLLYKFPLKSLYDQYKILTIGLGIITALSIGIIIDSFSWGVFTNTYLLFFKHNLGSTGAFNTFGIEPWWYYIVFTIINLAPILSLFFVFSIILFWIKKPKNVFTWMTFFTFVTISLFGHKEIRYVFPIYIFAPLFIIYLFETYANFKFINLCKFLVIISNLVFLIIVIFVPANTKVGVYEFLNKNYTNGETVYYIDNNPYLINDMEPLFYTKFLPKIIELKEESFNQKNILKNSWIVTNVYEKNINLIKRNSQCEKKYTSYPEKISQLNSNWKRLKINWHIIYCK